MNSKTWLKAVVGLVTLAISMIAAPKAISQTPQQMSAWLYQYMTGDLAADYTEDGILSPADFTAFIFRYQNPGGKVGDGGGDINPNGGGGGGDNVTVGWTEFNESSDTRKIYVAANGNDANHGLSPTRPLRTIAAGVAKLRDGYPDWLLLRRGDTFNELISTDWEKSGRSETEPMLISAYGTGARPVVIPGDNSAIQFLGDEVRKHIAFVSIDLRPSIQYHKSAVRMVAANVSDVLFEDLRVQQFEVGFVIQGYEGRLSDISIRRCVIFDNAGWSHAQGIYGSNTDGLLIEECMLDRNGWEPLAGRDATAGIFAHNVYIQRNNTGLVFRGNWSSRAAAEGCKTRSGGEVDNNIFFDNPIAVSFGNDGTNKDDRAVTGSVNGNVILGTTNITSTDLRGWGIRIENTEEAQVEENIVANASSQSGFAIALRSEQISGYGDDLRIARNIVHNHGTGIYIDEDLVVDVDVFGNSLTGTLQDEPLFDLRLGSDANLSIYNNKYRHETSGRPFIDGTKYESFSEWRAGTDRTAVQLTAPYNNDEATIRTYAQSIGMTMDQFYEAMRNKSKDNWDSDLTSEAIRAYFEEAFSPVGG